MPRKKIYNLLIIITYVLLLSQFLISNFSHNIGPNYTINRANNATSLDSGIYNCPNMATLPTAPPSTGFPFTTSKYNVHCNVIEATYNEGYKIGAALNTLYIATVSAITVGVLWKLNKHERPNSERTSARN